MPSTALRVVRPKETPRAIIDRQAEKISQLKTLELSLRRALRCQSLEIEQLRQQLHDHRIVPKVDLDRIVAGESGQAS